MKKNSLFDQQWLKEGYQLKAVACYYKTWQGYKMKDLHTHNQVEIMHVLKGECSVEFVDKTLHLVKGEFVLIDANIPHRLILQEDQVCRMLNLEFRFVYSEVQLMSFARMVESDRQLQDFLEHEFQYIVLKDQGQVFTILRQLVMGQDETQMKNLLLEQTLFFHLLIEISRLWQEQIEVKNIASKYIKDAITYIYHHYDQPIRVKDIADAINLNENYLQRIFKQNTQQTVVDFLTEVRLKRAKMLLINTNISVIEISSYVGINSRQYFSVLFKKHFGTSPALYRKKNSDEMRMSE